jgi:N-terminal C2 in EEIG1 and EHBP1 proteins
MLVDKRNMLQDVFLELEAWHEIPPQSGLLHHLPKDEKTKMGVVKINLAEYVKETRMIGDKDPGGVTRRHLLQDSKINCTLKVCFLRIFITDGAGYGTFEAGRRR